MKFEAICKHFSLEVPTVSTSGGSKCGELQEQIVNRIKMNICGGKLHHFKVHHEGSEIWHTMEITNYTNEYTGV